jgi:hypothetical protein
MCAIVLFRERTIFHGNAFVSSKLKKNTIFQNRNIYIANIRNVYANERVFGALVGREWQG